MHGSVARLARNIRFFVLLAETEVGFSGEGFRSDHYLPTLSEPQLPTSYLECLKWLEKLLSASKVNI